MRLLFLLLLALPILELMVMIKVGTYIGAVATMGLLLLAGVLGVAILRWQKFRRLSGVSLNPEPGVPPAKGLVEGLLLFFAGILLIIPGFITDVFGLILLLPFVRTALYARLLKSAAMSAWASQTGTFTFTRFGGRPPPAPPGSSTYEGEFSRDRPRDPSLRGPDQD